MRTAEVDTIERKTDHDRASTAMIIIPMIA